MEKYKFIISNLIKSMYYLFPNKIKIKSNEGKVEFGLDYYAAEKVAKQIGRTYYFDTELKFGNMQEFQLTYKELLKVKRAMKSIYGG